MPTPEELISLLAFPNESLSVEYKSWLNLSENAGKATLAKAAIALANHGGGIVVLGMRENNAEGGALGSQARPDGLARYSQDDVNAAINRFADPRFHCVLSFASHPETNIEHAFVSIPGGMTTPIMSRRGCEGVIAAQRCYIRKPGPQSQEPHTAEEWRALLDRCVRAGRESLLDAIRLIVQGHAGPAPSEEARDRLTEFIGDAQQRWQELIEPLPPDDAARMPLGHYELSFEILDVPPAPNLVELRRRLDAARQIRHTGWGPFLSLHREPFEPHPFEGLIETWLGAPEAERRLRTPAHCDFWRAHPDGRLFLQRGYDEDESERVQPGTCIDITLPIWRVGEAMLHAARLSQTFGDNPTIVVRCNYSGLQGRFLTSIDHRRLVFDNHICNGREATIEMQATATEIDQNLTEVLHPMLVPFYERFSFFELSMQVVVEEIEGLRRGRF
jgi:hypothetical protein